MEFFEDAVVVAKDTFDAVCKKTNEVVSIQKMKFNLASMQSKLSKDYEALGRLCLDIVISGDEVSEDVKALANEIVEKKSEIQAAKTELYKAQGKQICPKCNAENPQQARFCNSCGYNFAE